MIGTKYKTYTIHIIVNLIAFHTKCKCNIIIPSLSVYYTQYIFTNNIILIINCKIFRNYYVPNINRISWTYYTYYNNLTI